MKFSAIFKPTSLFSLKDSNSTNSGAKSLFLPSPYSIKMAIINQAITAGDQLKLLSAKKSKEFEYISKAEVSFNINNGFCVNNLFIKIQRLKREGVGYQSTVSFREFIHIPDTIEIIFNVVNGEAKLFLMNYIHKINYFGKRASFFQFLRYNEIPEKGNVLDFKTGEITGGIIQQYDDFPKNATFDKINSYSGARITRDKKVLLIPIVLKNASKSFSSYKLKNEI